MTRLRSRTGWVGLATAVALAAAAAWQLGAPAAAQSEPGAREIRIVVRYSRFEPDRVEVAPGETARFILENADPIDHEFIVGDARVQLVHEEGTEAHHGSRPGEISVPAGTTRSTTVTFGGSPTFTLFGCHFPGHYRYGMVGTIELR